MAFELRPIADDDACQALSLGDPSLVPLKTFLRRESRRLHRENLARTFVMVESGKRQVLAYASLVCAHLSVQSVPDATRADGFRYADYPAVKLARLAVDRSLQGQGVGGQLVDFAVALVVGQVMPNVGCRFLVVDAKPGSVGFCSRKGFACMADTVDAGDASTTMFIDLHRLPVPHPQAD